MSYRLHLAVGESLEPVLIFKNGWRKLAFAYHLVYTTIQIALALNLLLLLVWPPALIIVLLSGITLWTWDRLGHRLEPKYRRAAVKEWWEKEFAQDCKSFNGKHPRIFWSLYLLFAGLEGFENDLRQAWYDHLLRRGGIVEINIFVGSESMYVPVRLDAGSSTSPGSSTPGIGAAPGSVASSSTTAIVPSNLPSTASSNSLGSTTSGNVAPSGAANSSAVSSISGSLHRTGTRNSTSSATGSANGNPVANPVTDVPAAAMDDLPKGSIDDDPTTFEQLRMWFYWMQFRRGLTEIVLPKNLKRIDVVKVCNQSTLTWTSASSER